MQTYDYNLLTAKALHGFWEVILRHFPAANGGELSVESYMRLKRIAEDAVREWVSYNVAPSWDDAA